MKGDSVRSEDITKESWQSYIESSEKQCSCQWISKIQFPEIMLDNFYLNYFLKSQRKFLYQKVMFTFYDRTI